MILPAMDVQRLEVIYLMNEKQNEGEGTIVCCLVQAGVCEWQQAIVESHLSCIKRAR